MLFSLRRGAKSLEQRQLSPLKLSVRAWKVWVESAIVVVYESTSALSWVFSHSSTTTILFKQSTLVLTDSIAQLSRLRFTTVLFADVHNRG